MTRGAMDNIAPKDRTGYIKLALSLAEQSPPKPTNFCVGAVLVDEATEEIVSTGYTLELPGNTHAEQCCFMKFSKSKKVSEDQIGPLLPERCALYTTMEPCAHRASGNVSCVERILQTQGDGHGGIKTIYSGVKEPDTFVGENTGRAKLEKAGISCIHVPGMEEDILKVATAGHATGGQ